MQFLEEVTQTEQIHANSELKPCFFNEIKLTTVQNWKRRSFQKLKLDQTSKNHS